MSNVKCQRRIKTLKEKKWAYFGKRMHCKQKTKWLLVEETMQ